MLRRDIERRLARSYSPASYDDGWHSVLDYRRVMDYRADHPNAGSTEIARECDLPRSRIRPWLNGSAPDAVRGIQTAEERGLLDIETGSLQESAAAALVGWCCRHGSLTTDWTPRFVVSGGLEADALHDLGDVLGIRFRRAEVGSRVPEFEPREDARVIGRWLHALGVPPSGDDTPPEVPDWLHGELRERFQQVLEA